jgi:hypothetical protein
MALSLILSLDSQPLLLSLALLGLKLGTFSGANLIYANPWVVTNTAAL